MRGGIFGKIKNFLVFIFLGGVVVAFLSIFNWDVGALMHWFVMDVCLKSIMNVGEWFSNMEGFRRLLGK